MYVPTYYQPAAYVVIKAIYLGLCVLASMVHTSSVPILA